MAIILTPAFEWADGLPVTDSNLESAVITEKEKIKDLHKAFNDTKEERIKWPEVNGKEYTLTFVFDGPDPMLQVRLLKNGEGCFFVFEEYDELGKEHLNIFKVGDILVGKLNENIIRQAVNLRKLSK